MTKTVPSRLLISRGIYTFPEASRLTGIPTKNLRRWLRGYHFRHAGALHRQGPVFMRDLPDLDGEAALSFLDMIEAMFINAFHQEGVSWPHIRASAIEATELFGTQHPFCVRRFETDGRRIFATVFEQHKMDDERMVELVSRQAVFREIFKPLMRQLDYEVETDTVERWWPMGRGTPVIIDPNRSRGVPITRKSGVPTHVLSAAVDAEGGNVARVARWYEIPRREVTAAVRFEGRIAA